MAYKKKIGITKGVVYDDMSASFVGRRLYSVIGTIDYDYDENALIMQPNGDISDLNDRVAVSVQYPHKAKADGKIYPHLHWEQVNSNAVIFTLQYRIQKNGQAKTTAWTTMTAEATTDSVFTYVSGTMQQITKFKDGSSNHYIDMTGAGISATLQFRVTRSDATTGNILATFFDFHYEIDSDGSRAEFVK